MSSELYYIVSTKNLPSIFEHGILSHNRAAPYRKEDISNSSAQDIRAGKTVTADVHARKVHDFAVLYFNARNPMLYTLKDRHEELCVLRINPEVTKLPEAIVSDRNATAGCAVFYEAAEGVNRLNREILFADSWYLSTLSKEENKERGQIRCAELMVPNRIHPSYIGGAYVISEKAKTLLSQAFNNKPPIPVTVHPKFFFQKTNYNPQIPRLFNERHPQLTKEITPPQPPLKRARVKKIPQVEGQQPLSAFFVRAQKPAVNQPSVNIVDGDLLLSKMQTLVNTVNCQGVMGKGIAKDFKARFPDMFEDYVLRCEHGEVKPGVPYLFITASGQRIINFPTKDEWNKPSDFHWIKTGLRALRENAAQWGVTSLAIPPLGCGNGRLNWDEVRSYMMEDLNALKIPVEVYRPR